MLAPGLVQPDVVLKRTEYGAAPDGHRQSWIAAAVAAAVAYRRAGAPMAVTLLLALSALVFWHTPPIGPVGLVCFAAAVVLVARSWPATRTVETPTSPGTPAPGTTA